MELEGTVLGGKYRVVRQIGGGGMGRVFEAVHEQTERTVAVKVLSPDAAQQPDTLARFDREARAAGRIGHDNICEVIDVGFTADNVPYLVMPLLRGRALAALIRQEGPLALPRCVDVTLQILAALAAAHAAGIIHRDLKPDNVFLVRMGDREDFVKVLDFGIAKMVGVQHPDATLTQTGTVLGTPYYMSPEQARGQKDLDAGVDVYAMGAIVYQMLTGKTPFSGESYNQLLSAILLEDFPRPSVLRPDTPPALEAVVLKAAAHDRGDRYRDADEMRRALLAAVTGTALRPVDALGSSDTLAVGSAPPGSAPPSARVVAGPPAAVPTPPSATPPPAAAAASVAATAAPEEGPALGASRTGQAVLTESGLRAPRRGRLAVALAGVAALAVVAVTLVVLRLAGPDGNGGGDRSRTVRVRNVAPAAAAAQAPPPVAGAEPPFPPLPPAPPEVPVGPGALRPATATVADVPPADAAAAEASATVRITLQGVPEGARVRADGRDQPGAVFDLRREERLVKVDVAASGYEAWSREVSAASDATVDVELRRLPDRPHARDAATPGDAGPALPTKLPGFGEGA